MSIYLIVYFCTTPLMIYILNDVQRMIIMVSNWLLTGDCHRDFSRFKFLESTIDDNESAIIILGDAGINYCLDHRDNEFKNSIVRNYNCYFYCLRGNHEARPQTVRGMKLIYDENVGGEVYVEDEWPTIRYFKDWGRYTINEYSIAVIGGAYSVDKWYRLGKAGVYTKFDVNYLNCKKTGWFPDEQLNSDEMTDAIIELENGKYDFVFTHTCPIEWQPTDLFLKSIDDADNTMERFLTGVRKNIDWDVWCFGHYHDDRLIRPYVEMFYRDIEPLDRIYNRWQKYDEDGELDWWLNKDPNF